MVMWMHIWNKRLMQAGIDNSNKDKASIPENLDEFDLEELTDETFFFEIAIDLEASDDAWWKP